MSINKDFIVKNGLEVNGNLIRTNTSTNRVGINTNVMNATLDVNGAILTKNLSVSGLTTFTTFNVTNQIQLNGSSGSSGQYLRSTGTGVTWANFPVARTSDITTGILGQTLFPFNYTIGLVDVFVNGTKLAPSEFIAVDGLNIILASPCVGGETVELISYSATTLGITTTIGLQGITVREEGSPVGTVGGIVSLDFVGSGVTAVGSGIGATVYITASGGSGGTSYWAQTGVGIHTLSNVGIGTTNATSKLTISGDVSVSGVVTATTFVGNVTGTATTATTVDILNTNGLTTIYYPTFVENRSDGQILRGDVDLTYRTDDNILTVPNISATSISVGSTVTINSSGINATGVITATTFVGNFSGSITNATNLTGGTANASTLNVSGLATVSQGRIQADASANLRFGNLPAGSGSGRNIAIGDQVLASLSGGSGRNIGIGELAYYDTTTGQYNIGIGERAGQKVTTGAYNVILGAYDGQTGLDIRTLSNNVVIADGQGNIRQYINSSGNVGIKTTVITEALTVAGIVSATSFYGTLNAGQLTGSLPAINGSALIGVVGSGSGVIIQDDATPVGTAGTINFGSNLSVSFASGIATVTGSGLATYANVAGIATYASTAGVSTTSGTATYATSSGISTVSGTAGYATTAGISSAVSTTININTTGIITATSFSGSASGLTNIPAGQLTGALPAIDGSALTGVVASGTGVVIRDDGSLIGTAGTINFGTGLSVSPVSAGIVTVTSTGGSLQTRTTVTGVTTSITNNGIGNTDITGFKSYALMRVGLSTAGWLRLYTDSASRSADASRSQGIDPTPGSGVIAEVITTGISTTQIISPFVMGGNLNNPADTTMYAAITNLSGSTQTITANLTILQLEA